jgi:hypothetical protein
MNAIFGQFFIHVDLSCLGFNHELGENLKLANMGVKCDYDNIITFRKKLFNIYFK